MPERTIYLDHAATTALDARVLDAMLPYFTTEYGNASSIYTLGRHAMQAIDSAREQVAEILGCRPTEVTFTGCGSESDNLAIKGMAFASQKKGNHLITSPIEHHAVLHTCQYLERFGFKTTYVPVDAYGRVDPDDVGRAITDETILVSIMYANNEVGTIEPISEIGRVCRARKIPFQTAFRLAYEDLPKVKPRITSLRDRLIAGMLSIPGSQLTGNPTERLANNASFVFQGVEGESILLNLDLLGIAASTGSACTSGSVDPSHVLLAMHVPVELAHGSLRITLGKDNTDEDVVTVLTVLPGIIEKLRQLR